MPLGVLLAYAAALTYFAAAPAVPGLGAHDVNFLVSSGVGLVVAAGVVVASLPFRDRGRALLALATAGVAGGALLTALGAEAAASVLKAIFAGSVGYFLARHVREPSLVYLIAVVVLAVDTVSVTAGPTKILLEQHERTVDYLSIQIPEWGRSEPGAALGISDLIFLALFLASAWRFGLRRRLTPVALVASFIGSLGIGHALNNAVPALPLLSAALLLPNLDIVWHQLRRGPSPREPL